MDKALYGLFFLTLGATFYGLMTSGISLAVSLMFAGPFAVALFMAAAFIYFLFAVVFEPSPQSKEVSEDARKSWTSRPAFQHSNS